MSIDWFRWYSNHVHCWLMLVCIPIFCRLLLATSRTWSWIFMPHQKLAIVDIYFPQTRYFHIFSININIPMIFSHHISLAVAVRHPRKGRGTSPRELQRGQVVLNKVDQLDNNVDFARAFGTLGLDRGSWPWRKITNCGFLHNVVS